MLSLPDLGMSALLVPIVKDCRPREVICVFRAVGI